MVADARTYYTYRTAFGPITIASTPDAVTAVALGARSFEGRRIPTPLANRCATQLQEYFAGKRTAFDVPVDAGGTPFQQKVWRAVGAIPYGQVRTAAEVAAAVGEPEAHRAVGVALGKNPVAVLVPAHRVVTARGTVAGTGKGAELRRACLRLEQDNA